MEDGSTELFYFHKPRKKRSHSANLALIVGIGVLGIIFSNYNKPRHRWSLIIRPRHRLACIIDSMMSHAKTTTTYDIKEYMNKAIREYNNVIGPCQAILQLKLHGS